MKITCAHPSAGGDVLERVDLDVDLEIEPPCMGTEPNTGDPCPQAAQWRVTIRCAQALHSELYCTDHKDRLIAALKRRGYIVRCTAHNSTCKIQEVTAL